MNVLPPEQLLELTIGSTWLVKHKRADVTTEFKIVNLDEKGIVNYLGTHISYMDILLMECVDMVPRAEDATYPKLVVVPSVYAKPY